MKKRMILLFIIALTIGISGIFSQQWGAGTVARSGETWLIDYKIVWEDTREVVDSGTMRWDASTNGGSDATLLDFWACQRLGFNYNLREGIPLPRKIGKRNQLLIFMGFRKGTLADKIFGRN